MTNVKIFICGFGIFHGGDRGSLVKGVPGGPRGGESTVHLFVVEQY